MEQILTMYYRIDQWISDSADATPSPTTGKPQWHPIMSDVAHLSDEPNSIFTSDQYRPNSPSYLHLIPMCLDLFTEHIYPIMPLIHMPTLRASINRPLEMSEKNLLYSLCALTSTHSNQPFSLLTLLDFAVLRLPRSVSSSRLILFTGNIALIRCSVWEKHSSTRTSILGRCWTVLLG